MLLFQYDCVMAFWLATAVPCLKIHPLARQGPGQAAGASDRTGSVPELWQRGAPGSPLSGVVFCVLA